MSVVLVLGTVQLGLPYGRANATGQPSAQEAQALLRHALDAGVRDFDTARAYGCSEDRLGEALGGSGAHIVTKLSPLSDLPADASPQAVAVQVDSSIAASLKALKTARLETLLLHRAQHLDLFGGGIWQRLLHHQAQGRIGTLGVSAGSPDDVRRALAEPEVRHIQLAANMLDWRWTESGVTQMLRARANVTVHIRSIYLQGILPAAAPLWPHVANVDVGAVTRWLAGAARALGRDTVGDLALAYIRGQDWVHGAVVGLETRQQLETNLSYFAQPALSPDECRFIDQTRPHVPGALLDPAQWPKTQTT